MLLFNILYIFSYDRILIYLQLTFNEWYNFLLINKYSLSASGGKMATCVPSITPITPGKPPFLKNLEKK